MGCLTWGGSDEETGNNEQGKNGRKKHAGLFRRRIIYNMRIFI